MTAPRSHSVRLRLEVDQLVRDADKASKAVGGIGDAAGQAGQQAKQVSALGEAVRGTGRLFATAGTVAVGAVAALSVGVFRTGVAYNTLEQTSRAALTTLLGSAEAASAQMEKLREFGRSSPFPRQVWIEAQQQLLAFGLAAEDIIPTLSAIQDAVAAAGGGAEDIREVVRVLAQVQSTGKATAEVLNQLGARGIDAATLIGNAMGKTAAQIRDDISSGALDAATFLTVLTDAMTDRFGGAAENVKNTWLGAVDRIKGALRDIGSAVAEPFVDPAGGGAAVAWANSLADALRALEEQIRELVPRLQAEAGPALEMVTERLAGLADMVRSVDLDRLIETVATGAPVFAALGTALVTVGAEGLPVIGGLARAINPLHAGLVALALSSPEVRDVLIDLLRALLPLVPAVTELAVVAGGMATEALSVLAGGIRPVVDLIGVLVGAFTSLPGPVQTATLALVGMSLVGPRMGQAFDGIGTSLRTMREEMALQRALAGGITGGYQRLGDEARAAAPKMTNLGLATAYVGTSLKGLRGAAAGALGVFGGPWGLAITAAITAISVFASGQRDAVTDVHALTGALDEQTGALNDNGREWAANELEKRGSLEAAQRLGLDLDLVTNATLGEADAVAHLNRVLDENILEFGEIDRILNGYRDRLVAAGAETDMYGNITGEATRKVNEMRAQLMQGDIDARALQGTTHGLNLTVDEQVEAFNRRNLAAGEAADATGENVEGQNTLTGAVESATSALKAQHDELRAQIDPVFALHKAATELTAAQDNYNTVLDDTESTEADVEAATIKLAEAALAMQGAAGEASGMFSGRLSPALRATLEAANLTEGQIDAVEDALRGAAKAGDDYEDEYNAIVKEQGAREAEETLRRLKARQDAIDRTVTISYRVEGFAPVAGVNIPRRWGGITEHARTGLLRDAAVFAPQSPARFAFAEPATGGEAFVPKFGDFDRSVAVLSRAAQWYGQQVVPAGGSSRGMGGGDVHIHEIRAYSDQFRLGQMLDDLAMHGAS